MKTLITHIIVVSSIIIATSIIIITSRHSLLNKSKNCDTVVFVKDRLSIDARNVNHYSNGFSSITLCNGKTIVYNSHEIIKIIEN